MTVALKPADLFDGDIAHTYWYGIKNITTNLIGTSVIDKVVQTAWQMAERSKARLVDSNCLLRAKKRTL
jgi:hypothetical protein